jgi:PAS domain S-box-containing protein
MTQHHTTMDKSSNKATSKSIVFAENDVLVLEAMSEILREKGYEVHPARDGLQALRAIREMKPSYVILDIVMPKIDGSRVCWLIRQDRRLRDTPIIAFSALSPQQIRRFPELSADAYVAKGPLGVVANSLLLAIRYLDERGRGDFEGGIFGYEGFQPRQLFGEMLFVKRHYETLMRTLDCGVLELDQDGRILMANTGASEILGKKEIQLIAEDLPSLLPPRDGRVIQEILNDLKRSRVQEECRVLVTLRGQEVSLRFSSAVEEGECTGILVTLAPKHLETMTR